MGSSVSSLPDNLSEQEFQQLCGTSYNPLHYSSLKSPTDNQLHKDMILLLTSTDYEKEVFQLYLNYTPTNGELNSKIFVKLLKDTKSLNKNNFTSGIASLPPSLPPPSSSYPLQVMLIFYLRNIKINTRQLIILSFEMKCLLTLQRKNKWSSRII